jgi:hypothetical protein
MSGMSNTLPDTVTRTPAKRELLKELLNERNGMVPVWIRAPAHGPEFFSGMSRAKLYDLASRGSIKTKSIRDPGKERGCRLFNLRSILELIEAQPDEVNEPLETATVSTQSRRTR